MTDLRIRVLSKSEESLTTADTSQPSLGRVDSDGKDLAAEKTNDKVEVGSRWGGLRRRFFPGGVTNSADPQRTRKTVDAHDEDLIPDAFEADASVALDLAWRQRGTDHSVPLAQRIRYNLMVGESAE